MKFTPLAAIVISVLHLNQGSCSSSRAALPQAETTVLARIQPQNGRVGHHDQLEFVPDSNGDGLPELEHLVVFSREPETVLEHWTGRFSESACGQVVDGKPRLLVGTYEFLRILQREGESVIPGRGTHLTPCPISLARGTKYEGAVAVARHRNDITLEPVGSDWIEIVKITPPSVR